MAGNMPFIVARENTFFRAVEKINANQSMRVAALTRLIQGQTDPVPLWGAPAVNGLPATMLDHFKRDWFGNPPVGATGPVGLPAVDPLHPAAGWWANWFGDAHEIVRQTMQRAYQVALGVAPETLPITPTRNWPITVLWVCGAAFLHGGIVWDDHENGDGHVTVIFATPNVDEYYRDSSGKPFPKMAAGVGPTPSFSFGPGDHAFAVIGHESSLHVTRRRVGTKKEYVASRDEMFEQLGNSVTTSRIREMEKNSTKWGSAVPAGAPSMPTFLRVGRGSVITVRQ